MLLHWCVLNPSGPSNLAAIRFSSAVRIRSIRVFPTDAKPFAANPEIIARTEPATFYLEVFFNAHPIAHSDPKERPRAPNALVPSVIAYAGGQMDFTVDMGPDYATRLMIVKGKFESVSMAVYGDLVSEIQPPSPTYEPRLIPSTEQFALSRAVDPSSSLDPTMLANQLLTLIPDSPPLPLVIRLMLCLKPSNDDWELPDFPYLYADLDEDHEGFDLEMAYQWTSKPVPDDISQDTIRRFADRIAASIGPKNGNQSYLVAGILCQVGPQHPDMARILMETLDLEMIFDAYNMDELTVLRLLDAAANVDIARHLRNDWFLRLLQTIQRTPVADRDTQFAVRRLAARIQGWQLVEDALSNTQADFNEVVGMMKDISTEEKSFGIWLESMITHHDLVAKLVENPVLPIHQTPPSLLHIPLSVSHDEFIGFVRAYIGVSSVLAVYAWSDSVPNVRCRERALGVLRLWQGIDGYREIVNHLLLLRQMTYRLECLAKDHDPPTPSGIHVEHIVVDLANEPQSILRPDVVECILSLKQPLSYITEDERLTMRKVALVADHGLPVAIEELTSPTSHPMDMRRLRTLRVSLAIIERELQDEKGEWRVLQALWEDGRHGLLCLLVDIFVGTSDELKGHFLISSPPPQMAQKLVDQLFRMAADVLRLIARLAPAYPLTSRSTRMLAAAIADVFVHTDAADMLYSQSSAACIAAQGTRQTCIDLVRRLSDCQILTGSGKPSSETVLRTLLEHGVRSEGRDPVYHLLQVYCLIDHLLPLSGPGGSEDDEQSHWVTSVIPNVIPEIRKFFRVMDTENKVQFVKRLVNLDGGVVGIGEWLFIDELKHFYRVLQSIADPATGQCHLMEQHQVFLSLRFILDLIVPSSSTSRWCITSIETLPEAANTFADCLMSLLDSHIFPPCLLQIMEVLPTHSVALEPSLRFVLALIAFRAARNDWSFLIHGSPLQILNNLPQEAIDFGRLQAEIGNTLSSLASEPALARLDEKCAETLLLVMEWLCESNHTILSGISTSLFAKLCHCMYQTLPAGRKEALKSVRSKLTVDEDALMGTMEEISLPESLEITIEDVEDLLIPPVPVPSTPKRTPDLLGLVAISPPIAILRSPAATGLTKTYSNNDFRQLRTLPSARQNTSRLPSMHVDDFESSPTLVSVPMPDAFPSVSSAFNPQ